MKNIAILFLCWGILVFITGCGDKTINIPELPTIKIGSSGVSTSQDKGTPVERYENAYNRLKKEHLTVRQNLYSNTLAIKSALDSILQNLNIMKSLTVEPYSSGIQEYIEKYKELYPDFVNNRISSMTLSKFEKYENDVYSKFYPTNVDILVEPISQHTKPNNQVTNNNPTTPVKNGNNTTPPNTTDPKEHPTDTPFWIIYKAWEQAHNDLINAYTTKKGSYKKLYDRLKESLALLKKRLPQHEQAKLQIYINEYERIYNATSELTALHKGSTENDILSELKTVGSVISQTYNPDKSE